MISEPPGEPYYIGRIMEFIYKPEEEKKDSTTKKTSAPARRTRPRSNGKASTENFMVRVNWFYRPKDVSRPVSDPRVLYASMTSAICPIASIRGKCSVRHKDHISDMDEYRRTPSSFWFDKLYDLYIIRLYDLIPTEKMINFPPIVCEALCARFRFAIMEPGRSKEYCTPPCNCAKCSLWCCTEDSIICATCSSSYHMSCLNPPLARKPRHGFAWSCALCNKAYETKLQQLTDDQTDSATFNGLNGSSENYVVEQTISPPQTRYAELDAFFRDRKHGRRFTSLTEVQKHQLKLWPFRYLGAHAKIEDILDLDDRIYPRAVSRLGSKHQANVTDWPGRPVVYYEPDRPEKKSKKTKAVISASKPARIITRLSDDSEETSMADLLLLPKKDRPSWLQEKPSGFIERGGDETATLMWKGPPNLQDNLADGKDICDDFFDNIAGPVAKRVDVKMTTPNFMDACLKTFMDCNYDPEAAKPRLKSITKKSLKEPVLTPQEIGLFEEGVRKYGSELREVGKVVKTKKPGELVRFYYMWKKTSNGHKIWDNFEGRKRNSKARKVRSEGELIDEVADILDDSKYSAEKAKELHRNFICKHCGTKESEFWHRASQHTTAGDSNPIIALCVRCAILWRRYAVVWESPDEVLRKLSKSSSSQKRLFEDELLKDGEAILAEQSKSVESKSEPSRKKLKVSQKSQAPPPAKSELKSNSRSRTAKRSSPSNISNSSFSSLTSLSSLSSISGESLLEGDLFANFSPRPASSNADTQTVSPSGERNFASDLNSRTRNALPLGSSTPNSHDKISSQPNISLRDSPEDPDKPPIILRLSMLKSGSKQNGTSKEQQPHKNSQPKAESSSSQTMMTSFLASATPGSSLTVTLPNNQMEAGTHDAWFASQHTPSKLAINLKEEPNLAGNLLRCTVCGVLQPSFSLDLEESVTPSTWSCELCCKKADNECALCPVSNCSLHSESFTNENEILSELIRLITGQWAHLKCAIWTHEIRSNLAKQKSKSGIAQDCPDVVCQFCNSSFGTCSQCRHCGTSFHISCAEKKQLSFQFHLEPARPGSSTQSFEFNGKLMTAKPVILCKEAVPKRNMHEALELDKSTGKSLTTLYIENYLR